MWRNKFITLTEEKDRQVEVQEAKKLLNILWRSHLSYFNKFLGKLPIVT